MLQKLGFLPGFNKQVTETGAEGQWFDGDNVRFRYGTPEKIGGWQQLGSDKLTGAGRALHHFDNNAGIKYAAIGTNKILYVYSGGQFYDIHPIRTTISGVNFSSTTGSPTVTITFPSAHNLQDDDILLFENVSGITGSGSAFADGNFNNLKYMVASAPSATTITVTMGGNEGASPMTNVGSADALLYYRVGPSQQVGGFGWGTGQWSGTVSGPSTTTLSTALTDLVTTTIVIADSTQFPTSGEIRIGSEDISYTNNDTATGTLSGGNRGVNGTTKATHSAGATVTNISSFVAWGESSSDDVTLDPGLWVLDNFGTKLIALIYNGACFQWDSGPTNATAIRATIIPNAPTASRHVLVSTPDRHLVFFGTETTVGDSDSQDDMFIRFSDQENISGTNAYTVTATNTAGTQRLADGSMIMGAIRGRDAIYVWTDTALFLMRFVGQPFTFAFEQVGTNCGLLGKNSAVEVDGSAYWMSENGFFSYDGQLKSLPCLVEDFVYDDINTTARDLVNAGLNNLFGEVTWFYCTNGSNIVDRSVTYNYLDSTSKRPIWTTGSMARAAWSDSAVFGKPHATYYDPNSQDSYDVTGNTDGCTIYYEQETGTDQVLAGGDTTAIIGTITSGDFDITQRRSNTGQTIGTPDLRGDGEYIMKISRFLPDFISQVGATTIDFTTRDFPNSSAKTQSFTTTSATTKIDTRVRARSIAMTVKNTAASQDWKLGTFRLDIQPDGRR
jgi:hypothetical protein